MSNTRQPLLTEEQIQKMLEYANNFPDTLMSLNLWLARKSRRITNIVNNAGCLPTEVGKDLFLAFLRGKTKRVLNLDRLRADVRAWVDDPNRKYPEWISVFKDVSSMRWENSTLPKSDEELCVAASSIGINPDDYFEEQIIE